MVIGVRRGGSRLGCLVVLLLAAAGGYFAFNIGRVYLRYYEFQDAMAQQARFAAHTTDDSIVQRLRAAADSLGLPEGARRVHVRRTRNSVIFIWADYTEVVELPGFVRDIDFSPHVERAF
jgi:hypothetical protein